jgi:5-methylcytosine-specific restriction endonuclease McrA
MTYKEQIKHPKWQKKRLEILQRDGFKCQHCKSTKIILHVHHICYLKGLLIWEYDDELLITLCEDCHDLIHELTKVFALIAKDYILNKRDLTDYGRG